MPVRVQVVDHEIGAVGLYEPLPRLMRLDVLPFLLLYSTAAYLYSQRPQEDVIVAVFTALAVCFHALVFLAGEWNVSVFAWLTCAKLACINGNDTQKIYAMVTPSRSTLPCELCRCFIAAKSRQEKVTTHIRSFFIRRLDSLRLLFAEWNLREWRAHTRCMVLLSKHYVLHARGYPIHQSCHARKYPMLPATRVSYTVLYQALPSK